MEGTPILVKERKLSDIHLHDIFMKYFKNHTKFADIVGLCQCQNQYREIIWKFIMRMVTNYSPTKKTILDENLRKPLAANVYSENSLHQARADLLFMFPDLSLTKTTIQSFLTPEVPQKLIVL